MVGLLVGAHLVVGWSVGELILVGRSKVEGRLSGWWSVGWAVNKAFV